MGRDFFEAACREILLKLRPALRCNMLCGLDELAVAIFDNPADGIPNLSRRRFRHRITFPLVPAQLLLRLFLLKCCFFNSSNHFFCSCGVLSFERTSFSPLAGVLASIFTTINNFSSTTESFCSIAEIVSSQYLVFKSASSICCWRPSS